MYYSLVIGFLSVRVQSRNCDIITLPRSVPELIKGTFHYPRIAISKWIIQQHSKLKSITLIENQFNVMNNRCKSRNECESVKIRCSAISDLYYSIRKFKLIASLERFFMIQGFSKSSVRWRYVNHLGSVPHPTIILRIFV
ncbi:UvrABC system protein [Dirofilaria immitis]